MPDETDLGTLERTRADLLLVGLEVAALRADVADLRIDVGLVRCKRIFTEMVATSLLIGLLLVGLAALS